MKNPYKRAGIYYTHDEIFINENEYIQALPLTDYIMYAHQQDFYEINIITRGNGTHTIENNKFNVKVGDVFIIPPNVVHSYEGGKGFDVYHILISDNFIRKFISDLQQLPNFYILFTAEPIMRASIQKPFYLSLNKEQFEEINKLLNELLLYKDVADSISNIARNNLCMLLICKLCKRYSENLSSNKSSSLNSNHSFMNSITYIHENFNKNISIDNLCKIAHLSKSTYFRKFKHILKMSPTAYINKCKIEAVKNMLINTPISISEIASETGFYDISHLTKQFEAETGISPAKYRKKMLSK